MKRHPRIWAISLATVFISVATAFAQVPQLSPKDRDRLKSQSIALVKEFEQLLNVLASKGTTSSDAQDLVALATADEQTRIFSDPRVVLEDDLFSIAADSAAPKDVSVQKYLNDWDLFYTKGFEETVSFSDLRISDFSNKGYLYLKVFYLSQFKNKHKDFDRNYRTTRRVASIRFDLKNGKYSGHINGISFFRSKNKDGSILNDASIEAEYKPFIKEHKIRLSTYIDSSITEAQIALQRKSDSLYAEAVKMLVQRTEEQQKQDVAYTKALKKGDSLVNKKDFASAIESFTEARAFKPLETYPRRKIKELTKLLAGGGSDLRQMFNNQYIEGDRLFKLRDYEGARQAYQSAYTIMPDNAAVVEKFNLTDKLIKSKADIRSKYMAGNFRLALKDYARIISENKTNPDWYFERARCYQTMGDNKKALADLTSALELDASFAEALQLRASTNYLLKDIPKAISDYDKLITMDSKVAEYHQRKGILLATTKAYDMAISEFDQALILDPKDVQSATIKAEMLRRKSNLILALASAELAISINPNYSTAIFQKGMILLEKGEEAAAAVELQKVWNLGLNADEEKELKKYHDNYMVLGQTAATKGQAQEAIKLANKALVVMPKSVEAIYFLAGQKLTLGKENEAITDLDRCISIDESYVPAYIKKGQILLTQKQYKSSAEPFLQAYHLDNRSNEACQGLGDVSMAQEKYDSAMVWFSHAFLIKSSDVNTLVKRGKCHYKMENYQKALLDFENAIREDNKMAEAYMGKGMTNKALRKPFDAIDNYNEALRLGYNRYDGLLETGMAYASMDNHKQAIKSFTEAINLNPGKGEAYGQRGFSYLEKADFGSAQADFLEAVKHDSIETTANCSIELGFLYVRSNDFVNAEKNFNRILALDPNHPRANYGMAVLLYNQGKTDASMTAFSQAFQTGKLEYNIIRKDPWMQNIIKDKAFIAFKDAGFK